MKSRYLAFALIACAALWTAPASAQTKWNLPAAYPADNPHSENLTAFAKDVDAALHQVVEKAGGKSPEQAAAYIQNLKTTKRYARDVY